MESKRVVRHFSVFHQISQFIRLFFLKMRVNLAVKVMRGVEQDRTTVLY